MPLPTFFKLDQEKQDTILQAAFEEFALHDYGSASISRIVRKAGISSNGTFFRYFRNKLDVYTHLMEVATNMRLDSVQQLFAQTENFYELLVQNFYMKIKFDIEHPVEGQFLYNTMQERYHEDLGDMMLKTKTRIMHLVKGMLHSFQQQGNIRTDLEADLIAFSVMQIQIGVYDYLAIKYNLDASSPILQKNPSLLIPESEIMSTVKAFAEILRSGLKPATI